MASLVTQPFTVQSPDFLVLPILSIASLPFLVQSPLPAPLPKLWTPPNQVFFPMRSVCFPSLSLTVDPNERKKYQPVPKKRGLYSMCSFYRTPKEEEESNKQQFWVLPLSLPAPEPEPERKETETETRGLDWPILKRWDVPWNWQMLILSMFALEIGPRLAYEAVNMATSSGKQLTIVEMGRQYLVSNAVSTAIVLGVLYHFKSSNIFQPLPDDIFCYDPKRPFNLRKGWLLWAGVGFAGALFAVVLTSAIMRVFFRSKKMGSLEFLLPVFGASRTCTAFLVGVLGIGVLGPMLEEATYRGFLMVSLTKWFSTPKSVLLSAAVFAIAHLDPGRFPQVFVIGIVLGFSYAQTRNLLTPITIHVLWNSLVLLLIYFKCRGRDLTWELYQVEWDALNLDGV